MNGTCPSSGLEGIKRDRPVVLFGGSFDPPHHGHLIVAQDLFTSLSAGAVAFVPAAHAPHKADRAQTPVGHRLEMTALALGGDPRFVLYAGEAERGGISYTIDTVEALRAAGYEKLYVAIGADNLSDIPTWKDWAKLIEITRLVVMTRPGVRGAVPAALVGRFTELAVTAVGISSTLVRERVRSGLPIKYLVPDAVASYIFEHKLYR